MGQVIAIYTDRPEECLERLRGQNINSFLLGAGEAECQGEMLTLRIRLQKKVSESLLDLPWVLVSDQGEVNRDLSLLQQTGLLLREVGFTPDRRSYRYLCQACSVWIHYLPGHPSITKDVYPDVAQLCCVSSSAVERSIRQSIDKVWKSAPTPKRMALFPPLQMDRAVPTNTQFISTLAEHLLVFQKSRKHE